MPYRIQIHERRHPDNKYDLSNLHSHNTGFAENHILDLLESFFDRHLGDNLTVPSREKALIIQEFEKEDNIIEGIISSGNYGWRSVLRDVETGDVTHVKDEDEVELLPFYFLSYFPHTQHGELYDSGKNLFIVLQQVNRLGIKTFLAEKLEEFALSGVNDAIMKFDPVYSSNVLEKVIEADRIMRLELETHEIPDDFERRMEILDGLRDEDLSTQTLVLKPDHGGSIEKVRRLASRHKERDTHFASEVSEDVNNMRVTINKGGGRSETFSLLDHEVAMKKDLDDDLNKQDGLITAQSLRRETNRLFNEDLFNTDIVEEIEGDTTVDRALAREVER